MIYLNANKIGRVVLTLACCLIAARAVAIQPYLEDFDNTTPPSASANSPNITQHRWPRVMMAETQTLSGDPEKYSKYQIIATAGGVLKKLADLQSIYPDLMYFRMINPNEYLGYNDEDFGITCPQGHGNPFESTADTTGDCAVFAGHWLYQAGTLTSNSLTVSGTTVQVNDASIFTTGEYAVIYNAPAGSFGSAEHVRISARNLSNNTLTLQRGYKSTARFHASGSIIAQHVRGQGVDDPRNWAYNLSNQCPRDAANRRYYDFLPIWINQNYKKNHKGEEQDINVSGFLFDSDFNFVLNDKKADVNNDLIIDDGISPSGINWYGNGFNLFYSNTRSRFPNLIMSGGIRDSLGFNSMNGTQMEGFPSYSNFKSVTPDYSRISTLLSKYSFNLKHRDNGPAHTHVLSKTPSKLYPFTGNPSNNRTFRFALGMTLLDNGYFAFRNTEQFPDVWFDEYAVDVTNGSPTYGEAVTFNPTDETLTRANMGWLGQPAGPRKRIYNDADFAPNQSLISDSTFDSNLDGWEGDNVVIARRTTNGNFLDGGGAMFINKHQSYQKKIFDAAVKGPMVTLTAGRSYTLVFSAKATGIREINASVPGHNERFFVDTNWQRYVMSFTATSTESGRVRLNVGRENTDVWLDSVYLFEEHANVFRRDYDKGIVVVNATPNTQTVALNNTFQRIRGTQDPGVNTGAILDEVTLPPYDAAILVRLENTSNTDTQQPWITITAPTKIQNSAITDTTIVAQDLVAINANSLALRDDNTAGVSNLNCVQTTTKRADCTVRITSSGDLKLTVSDAAGNVSNKNENGYLINSGNVNDTESPYITVDAPTKVSSSPILNTTITAKDDIDIRASGVALRSSNTAGVRNFNCTQTNQTQVDCTLEIVSSGDLKLISVDYAGNVNYKTEAGYVINNTTTPPPPPPPPPVPEPGQSLITPILLLLLDE